MFLGAYYKKMQENPIVQTLALSLIWNALHPQQPKAYFWQSTPTDEEYLEFQNQPKEYLVNSFSKDSIPNSVIYLALSFFPKELTVFSN